MKSSRYFIILVFALTLSACGGSSSSSSSGKKKTPTYSVSVEVTGLGGSALIVENNGEALAPIDQDGTYTFPSKLGDDSSYNVLITQQPDAGFTCAPSTANSGVIAGANVTVPIICSTTTFEIGGTVTGLDEESGSGLVLQNNGSDDLTIDDDGSFSFSARIPEGGAYNVTVLTQPSGAPLTCQVTNASGTVASADIDNIAVDCEILSHDVSVTVSGLISGTSLTLENNADELIFDADGSDTFATQVADGQDWEISVTQQPGEPRQECRIIENASGTMDGPVTADIRCGLAYHILATDWSLEASPGEAWLQYGNTDFAVAIADRTGAEHRLILEVPCEVRAEIQTIQSAPAQAETSYGCDSETDIALDAVLGSAAFSVTIPEENENGDFRPALTLDLEQWGPETTEELADAVGGKARRNYSFDNLSGEGLEVLQVIMARQSDNATVKDLDGHWGVVRLKLDSDGDNAFYDILTASAIADEEDFEIRSISMAEFTQPLDGSKVIIEEFAIEESLEFPATPIFSYDVTPSGLFQLQTDDILLEGFISPAADLMVAGYTEPALGNLRELPEADYDAVASPIKEMMIGVRAELDQANMNGRTYDLIGTGFWIGSGNFEITKLDSAAQIQFGTNELALNFADTYTSLAFGNAGGQGLDGDSESFPISGLPYSLDDTTGRIMIDASSILDEDEEAIISGFAQAQGNLLIIGFATKEEGLSDTDAQVGLWIGVCSSGC